MSIKTYIRRCARALCGKPDMNITATISTTMPSNQLLGRRIIVTGGGHGLGAALAKKFIDEGAHVLIAGRNKEC